MPVEFSLMEQHREAPRAAAPAGKLVLSRLRPGSSVIGANAPSVKLVLEGEEAYEVDGRTIRIRPGQFLYLEAGAECIGSNRAETIGLCLMLPSASAEKHAGWANDALLGRAVPLSARTSAMGEALLRWGRDIARNPSLGPALAPEIVARVGAELAAPLAESRAVMANIKAAKASTRRELFQRLERARAHLHEHDDRAVDLSELASIAGVSQFHLARYFKLAFGAAPIAYHRRLRLARAAAVLVGGCATVAEAAEAAGYSDAAALTHAFRRRFGAAPQQWAMARIDG